MIAQEVTWQLAEAASQAAVLQLAATQAARVLMMKKMKEEEACDLFMPKVALPCARLPPLPEGTLVRAATRSMSLLPVCWRCGPWPGTPQLTPPVIFASVVSSCCVLMGFTYFVAFFVAIWLVLWLAVALMALLVVAQAVALQ
jgi:hypothetical protein